MTTCYRIYTERKADVLPRARKYFDCFTLYDAFGVWKGNTEYSAIIEVIGPANWLAVKALATEIRIAGNQESVLITEQPVTVHLI